MDYVPGEPIIISDRAAARLSELTRDGRTGAEVIEDALERMPEPSLKRTHEAIDIDERKARIMAILERTSARDLPIMEEFDREEYDENGNPR